MAKLYIEHVSADEFGIVAGSGWVVKQNGKRLDWPMLSSHAQALVDLADFERELGQLASDEASERFMREIYVPLDWTPRSR